MHDFLKKQRIYPLTTFIFLMLVTTYTAYFYYQSQYQYSVALVSKLAEQQAENLNMYQKILCFPEMILIDIFSKDW